MFKDKLMTALKIKTECIWVKSTEEWRAYEAIRDCIQVLYPSMKIETISMGIGVVKEALRTGEKTEVMQGVISQKMMSDLRLFYEGELKEQTALIYKDGHHLMETKKDARAVKDIKARVMPGAPYCPMIVISPTVNIVPDQDKMWTVIDMDLLSTDDIKKYLNNLKNSAINSARKKGINFNEDIDINACANLLTGLTFDEINLLAKESVITKNTFSEDLFKDAKIRAINKTGMLKYIKTDQSMETIGGNGNFKDWVREIKTTFSEEAEAFGVERPKGYLSLGIPGQLISV